MNEYTTRTKMNQGDGHPVDSVELEIKMLENPEFTQKFMGASALLGEFIMRHFQEVIPLLLHNNKNIPMKTKTSFFLSLSLSLSFFLSLFLTLFILTQTQQLDMKIVRTGSFHSPIFTATLAIKEFQGHPPFTTSVSLFLNFLSSLPPFFLFQSFFFVLLSFYL